MRNTAPKNPLPFGTGLGRFLLWVGLTAGLASGCGSNSPEPQSLPQVDYLQAKALSDAAVRDLMQDNVKDLSDNLDSGFRTVLRGPDDLKKVVGKMYDFYGRPTKCDYQTDQSGVRTDGTWKRASRSFYYSVKTTKYPAGIYFLKVEVVNAYNSTIPDVSGFGFFKYKQSNISVQAP